MTLLGIETEYGIHAPAAPDASPGWLSAAVVQHVRGAATGGSLDWHDPIPIEDPHNRMLGNGARFYVDHAHPEYSGPEVTSALAAAAYDLAGDEIVAEAARAASAALGLQIRIFKNNTDGHGASYGCHENYLLSRATPWQRVVDGFTPYLVSRTVLTGAGRIGLGQRGERPGFQLSQRADFFETEVGIETTRRRPIINTRDEPHAPRRRYRRLHVITGDANRSPWSTWLKTGTAAAVLAALEADALPDLRLTDPVSAMHAVSHDLDLNARLSLRDGRRLSALDLQEAYAQAVLAHEGRFAVDTRIADAWVSALTDLRADSARCADRLDWAAKYNLLAAYRERHGLGWDSPRLAQLDLAWADLDPTRSPFDALQRSGRIRPLLAPEAVAHAAAHPPEDTRAWLRGTLVRGYGDRVQAADWTWLSLRDSAGRLHRIDLAEPLEHTRALTEPRLAGAATLDAVLRRLAR